MTDSYLSFFTRHLNLRDIRTRVEDNPQLWLAALLFSVGAVATVDKISPLAGALFGAGASLLGAGITEIKNKRVAKEEKSQRQNDALACLAPELHRTIDRALYIHSRALPNYVSAWAEHEIKPNDLKEDFVPYEPILYPNAPQFRDLPTDKAIVLISFYDSLHVQTKFVEDWWAREGQLPINIFNMILHNADEMLRRALVCIKEFDLEQRIPPKYESWGTMTSRIERSLASAEESRKHHIARSEVKAKSKPALHPKRL